MIILGVGNTGMRLAHMFDEKSVLISTASQDTNNFVEDKDVLVFSNRGASKRFKIGTEIWAEKFEGLRNALIGVKNETVVIFSSFGGGSGSSSLFPISKILLENNCKLLIVGVLPFRKENNPALSNAVQSINSLIPLIDKISVLIFDNEKLIREYDGSWKDINKHIVRTSDYLINLVNKYSSTSYSPMTIDQSELESVIFGGGFIDFSYTFIEEETPKFEYGVLDKHTKNCLMAMVVDNRIKDQAIVDSYLDLLTKVIKKYSSRISNARLIPGILRASISASRSKDITIKDRCYFTIASGLSIDRYIKKLEKIRDSALEKAIAFSEKNKMDKILDGRDSRVLDV